MTTEHNFDNFPIPAGCDVCGAELSKVEVMRKANKDYGVCSSVECKTVMEQQAWMAPAIFQPHLIFQRKLILDRRKNVRERDRYIESIQTAEEQENGALLKSMLENTQGKLNKAVHALGIPSGPSELTLLNTDRIAKYKEHLKHVIADAALHNQASDVVQDQHYNAYEKAIDVELRLSSNAKLRSLSDRLCTLCKGGCCTDGADHSFIRTITIRRYMDLNPTLSQSAIYARYTAHLNEKTIEGSCINHAEKGCTLPRSLRSDLCNGFYCDSLNTYQKQCSTSGVVSVLAIQRANTNSGRFDPEIENTVTKIELIEVD
jgi:hypothetical protein